MLVFRFPTHSCPLCSSFIVCACRISWSIFSSTHSSLVVSFSPHTFTQRLSLALHLPQPTHSHTGHSTGHSLSLSFFLFPLFLFSFPLPHTRTACTHKHRAERADGCSCVQIPTRGEEFLLIFRRPSNASLFDVYCPSSTHTTDKPVADAASPIHFPSEQSSTQRDEVFETGKDYFSHPICLTFCVSFSSFHCCCVFRVIKLFSCHERHLALLLVAVHRVFVSSLSVFFLSLCAWPLSSLLPLF